MLDPLQNAVAVPALPFYKVVRVTKQRKRYSANASPPFKLRYHVNKTVTAKVGGALVFNSEEEACRFARQEVRGCRKGERMEVWACATAEQVQLPTYHEAVWEIPRSRWRAKLDQVRLLWSIRYQASSWRDWPEGSVAFQHVKLLKRCYSMVEYVDPANAWVYHIRTTNHMTGESIGTER